MSTLIESTGAVSLHFTPNPNGGAGGTYFVRENGATFSIKDHGTVPNFSASDIVAADFFNGYRVVAFSGGHTWYVDANWQKATVGPNGVDTTQLSNAQIATLGVGAIVNPFYSFETSTPSITEGQTATLDVVTINVAAGTVLNYALLGVVGADIVGGSLTGSTVVNSVGRAVINIPTLATPQVGTKNLSVSLSVSGNWVSGVISVVDAVNNGPITRTLVESTGQISLYRNSDGSYAAQEGGIYIPIKDYGSSSSGFIGGQIAAADIVGGVRVVAFSGGHAWYVDSNWRKAPVGPGGVDTAQLSSGQIAALGTGASLIPTYSFSVANSDVIEGQSAIFNLSTTNLPPGTNVSYAILGLSAGDVGGGNLTGTVTIDGAGRATIMVPTEITPQIGTKTVSISLTGPGNNLVSSPITIADAQTSLLKGKTLIETVGKVALYYTPNSNGTNVGTFSVQEGSVTSTIKNYGGNADALPSNVIVAADYFNGYRVVVFNGGHTWYVDSNWQKAPVGPNGVDTTQLSSAQIAVLGTGAIVNPVYSFETLTPRITEGQTASFQLVTTNVAVGTKIDYALLGVVGSDIAGGSLTGTVVVDNAGRAMINIPTLVNNQVGNKNLSVSLSVSGNWVSGVVNVMDNAIAAPVSRTLVESNGTVSLYSNSDGTYSTQENGVFATIKDYGVSSSAFRSSGIVAADYVNGVRAVVFNSGHTWYADSNWQKAPVGPNGADTTQLSSAQMATLLGNTQGLTKKLVEGTGRVSLYSNSDGTFSASENGVLTAIKDYGNPPTPTRISNIVAVDYLNDHRVVTFFGGHTWYVDANWQKAPVGPSGQDTTQLTPDQVSAMTGGVVTNPVIVRSLIRSSGEVSLFSDSNGTFSVLENGLYSFVKDINSSTPTQAAISGAGYYNGARIVVLAGGSDSANFWYVDSSWSKAPVGPSGASEGVLSQAQLASVFPTAIAKVMPTYSITATTPFVIEGQVASFDLNATNLAVGTKIDYALLGVVASDIVGGQLTGSVVVDARGYATISVPTAINADVGNKNLSVSLSVSGNVVSSSILLKDPGVAAAAPSAVINTAVVGKTIGDVKLAVNGTSVILKDAAGTEVTAVLDKVQRLQFNDTMVALDIGKDQTAGSGYMLYKAAFNRTPDAGGLGFWINKMDVGMGYSSVAQNFVNSTEFKTAFGGANPTVNTLATKLYNNVLNRTPDAAGLAFWQEKLTTGWSTADVLGYFATSSENVANVTPLITNGIQYQQFVG